MTSSHVVFASVCSVAAPRDIKTPESQTQDLVCADLVPSLFHSHIIGSAAAAAAVSKGAAQPLLIYFSHYFRQKCALLLDYERRVQYLHVCLPSQMRSGISFV